MTGPEEIRDDQHALGVTGRRRLLQGVAWVAPAVVVAVPAPVLAASNCDASGRQIVFADSGVHTAAGGTPTNLLSYSYSRKLNQPVTTADGLNWEVSSFVDTITNTSSYTITDIVSPAPFMGNTYPWSTWYHATTWDSAQQLWLSTDLPNPSPSASYATNLSTYQDPNEPNTGNYVLSLGTAPTDATDASTASPIGPVAPFNSFSGYMSETFAFNSGSATVSGSDQIPVVSPAVTALAPGESTTIAYTVWRERKGGNYLAFNFPTIVIGTVSC